LQIPPAIDKGKDAAALSSGFQAQIRMSELREAFDARSVFRRE
jgi:hypothetical protein